MSVGRSEPFHTGLDPILFPALTVPSPHLGEEASLRALAGLLDRRGSGWRRSSSSPGSRRLPGCSPTPTAGSARRRAWPGATGPCSSPTRWPPASAGPGTSSPPRAPAVSPDILCLGKGLSGGYLPLSAVLITEEIFGRFTAPYSAHRTLYYGHTYTGNPVACAVARASLRLFEEEGTLGSARRLAATLERLLEERVAPLPGVFEIRRRGVMTGIELRDGALPFAPALRVGRAGDPRRPRPGVVVRPLGDVVVLNPPLS